MSFCISLTFQDICMVFEVLGDNLLKLIIQHKYKGLPLSTVKSITAQVNISNAVSLAIFIIVLGAVWTPLHAYLLSNHSHRYEAGKCSSYH